MKKPKEAKISEESMKNLVIKSFETIAESDKQSEEVRKEASQCSLNPPDIQELCREINTISRKNPEKFSTKFYEKFLIDPCKFLGISNRNLAAKTLTKLCLVILAEKKRAETEVPEIPVQEITSREKAGLQYLGGYLLQTIFKQVKKKNKSSSSNEGEEMIALLKSCKTTFKPENQKLVFALDRGGLWYTTDMFQDMIIVAEKIFSFEVRNRLDIRKIDYVSIICKMTSNADICRLFHEHSTLCDIEISEIVESNTLHSILHLYLKVRAYNYTKDYVQKQRLKKDNSAKKALRTELKNISAATAE